MAQNYTFFSEPPKEIPFIRRSAETEDSNKLNAVRRGHQVKMCPADLVGCCLLSESIQFCRHF